jgi:hypothetical protein
LCRGWYTARNPCHTTSSRLARLIPS